MNNYIQLSRSNVSRFYRAMETCISGPGICKSSYTNYPLANDYIFQNSIENEVVTCSFHNKWNIKYGIMNEQKGSLTPLDNNRLHQTTQVLNYLKSETAKLKC